MKPPEPPLPPERKIMHEMARLAEDIPQTDPFLTVFQLMEEARRLGFVTDYVVSGGVAVMQYVEPIETFDLDLAVTFAGNVDFQAFYKLFKDAGAVRNDEGLLEVQGLPMQIIAPATPLMQEAVEHPLEFDYATFKIKVLRTEYLVANYLYLLRKRPDRRIRDTLKLNALLLQPKKIDVSSLNAILTRFGLEADYQEFLRRFT